MTIRKYIMDASRFHDKRNRSHPTCVYSLCKDPAIKIGDIIISKTSTPNHRKLYHLKCAKALNIV